jgi:prepilin-type N-terminal cleavage/methylation domain-containing protein
MAARHPARQPAGFTLFELLIALLVASILMTMVYQVYIQASRTFRVQNMALEMQSQLRFGLDHLSRDMAAAGYNAVVNSAVENTVCNGPSTPVRAITVGLSQPLAVYNDTGINTNLQAMEITLLGAYNSGGNTFFTQKVSGNTIVLQTGFTATLRTQADWDRMFGAATGRFVRLIDSSESVQLLRIASSDYATGSISLSDGIIASGICSVAGMGLGLVVNSVNHVRYRIARHPTILNRTDLVREDVDHDGVTAIANSILTIAANVIDLSLYDVIFDTSGVGALSPTLGVVPNNIGNVLADISGAAGRLGSTAEVQDIRFATVSLTVRTDDEDLDLVHRPRTAINAPVHTYDRDTLLEGAARALTLTSRVEFTTIGKRNIKP